MIRGLGDDLAVRGDRGVDVVEAELLHLAEAVLELELLVRGGRDLGLARRFGMSANTVRLLFVLSCLLPGPQFIVYLALWILMPQED